MRRASDRPDLPPEEVDLTQDMAVLAATGRRLGRLDEARCPGEDHVAQWLVVRRLGDRRLIANPRVTGGRGSALLTDLRPSEWRSLVEAVSDDAVRTAVEASLQGFGDPAQSLLRTLTVRVAAQRVFIEGYLASPERIAEVERQVRALPGVLDVRTRIITDLELEAAVARALSRDPSIAREPIRVQATLGRVDLLGQVSSARVATAADRIAAAVPGVLAVHTYLAFSAPPPQSSEAARSGAAHR